MEASPSEITPEQRAQSPDRVPAGTVAMLEMVNGLLTLVRAARVERAAGEYPAGHPERHKLPAVVRQWELERGPAPESAARILDRNELECGR